MLSKKGEVAEKMAAEREKILENQQQLIKELYQNSYIYSQIEREQMEKATLREVIIGEVIEGQASQIMATLRQSMKEKEMELFHEIDRAEVLFTQKGTVAMKRESDKKKKGDTSRVNSRIKGRTSKAK